MSSSAQVIPLVGPGGARDAAARVTEERLVSCAGVINRATAELVAIVADALADGSWEGAGYTSAAHWLRLKAGLSAAHARQVVDAARRRAELPQTMGLLERGEVTLDQASVVVRHVPAAYEASVAEMAPYATVDQLRRATRTYAFDPTADQAEAAEPAEVDASDTAAADTPEVPACGGSGWEQDEPSSLSMQYTELGRFLLRYEGPASEGALIETAVRETKDALWRHLNPPRDNTSSSSTSSCADDDDTDAGDADDAGAGAGAGAGRFAHVPAGTGGGVSMAQAFVELASHSLASIASEARRDRYRVYVHLDTDGAWLGGKPRLPRHVMQSLTCDGVLQPVWHTEGHPVNVGRSQRIVPDRTRRLLLDRDRGCRFPGCGTSLGLEVHHIRHWIDGGRTDTPELVSLCTTHHDAHHRGEFTIHGDADAPDGSPGAVEFLAPGGWSIAYQPPPPDRSRARYREAVAAAEAGVHPRYSPPTGERLQTHWVTFYPHAPAPTPA